MTALASYAMPIPREKLRLRDPDRAALLNTARTAHCATVGADGVPHVVPLWFVWHDGMLYVNSLRRSQRGRHLAAGSPVSICIDAGVEYVELHGLVTTGRFEPETDPATLRTLRLHFGEKYWHGVEVPEVRSHDWFRLVADREVSWDFRRIAEAGGDPRLDALDASRDR